MKMARASNEDLEAALLLRGILCDVFDDRIFPRGLDGEFDPGRSDFDEDDYDDLRALYERLEAVMRQGGLTRVIGGMHTLMNPENRIIDPDKDHLAPHPALRWVETETQQEGEGHAGCTWCGGGGCVHCIAGKMEKLGIDMTVGVFRPDELERVLACLNERAVLELKLAVVVPSPGDAEAVWRRFSDKPPFFAEDPYGARQGLVGKVPVPASRETLARLKALLQQMERSDPESDELRHARRAEVERLEALQPALVEFVAGPVVPGPLRIVLQRTKGWRMPDNTVKVDRTSKWGNPFKVGTRVTGVLGMCKWAGQEYELKTTAEAVHCYRLWQAGDLTLYGERPPSKGMIRHELRGKNLACWCKAGEACHVDVLLEIANREEASDAA